jgi:hypothetical protein
MRPRKPLVKPTPEQEALCKEYRTADTQDRKYKTDKYKTALSAAHREAYLIVQRYGAAVNHRKNMQARSSAEAAERQVLSTMLGSRQPRERATVALKSGWYGQGGGPRA